MRLRLAALGAALALCGCGPPAERAEAIPEAPRPTVFDPLTGTLDRAAGVQQTIDQRAAADRRRLEEAEGERD